MLILNAFSFIGLYFLYKLVPFVVNEKYAEGVLCLHGVPGAPGMQSRVIFIAHLSRFYDRNVLLLEAREVWIRGAARDIFHFYAPIRRGVQYFRYTFFSASCSDNWHKNIVIGAIAIVIAIQNMFIWITGAWLY